jgi:CRISPR-associated endonuclease/helicase Cas3
MSKYFAHSENSAGVKHDLVEHLRNVAQMAADFAGKFGAADLGYWAGLWHDLGKFHPDFQSYIAAPDGRRGPDHSSAGAIHATRFWEGVAFLVAGHHAGLPGAADLKIRMREKLNSPGVGEALRIAESRLSPFVPHQLLIQKLPDFLRRPEGDHLARQTELFLRMLFSALVDADFLDTEAHFDPRRSVDRAGGPSFDELWRRFDLDQGRITGRKGDRLNEIRHEIYGSCVAAGDTSPGIFTLTVPTGGGKTRSAMAFALRHSLRHGLDRVIVAIPYTSIIDQTAQVYRDIFGDRVVLEHHSGVLTGGETTDPVSLEDVWVRLASENWDAPIVVTTTVQLFESLFANRASGCRKLHNVARSVLILDEVQTLPTNLLVPILDVLQELADHYRVTVVLCTATQPALTNGPYLKGLRNVREIIADPSRYFAVLKRVHYECPTANERWNWERVADEMRTASQSLAVVNTKRDAFRLLDALNDPSALHLSTQMCGVHRLETLREVRRRLDAGEPCRLVSTQVVEAGVDLDFPLVLRAIGPLDRIVQAAGRCNREGNLEFGRVVIFDPAEGSTPPGIYRSGTDTAASLLATGCDLHDPLTYQTYFQRLFQVADLDSKHIQTLRQVFDFPGVAGKFKMIEDDSVPAVVRPERYTREVESLLVLIRQKGETPRWAFRRLQPYLVSLRSHLIPSYQNKGLLQELAPGLWEWLGGYDPVRGLVEGVRAPEDLVI